MRRLFAALTTAALIAATVSCGHTHPSGTNVGSGLAPTGRGEVTRTAGAPRHAPTIPLADALEQIDAYPAPKGVSAETWAALKAELKRLLIARAEPGTGGRRSVVAAEKTLSTAPIGSQNAVSDLTAVSNAAGTQATLSWTEVLPGDYDSDGEVSIADLQPVALYYGQWTDSGPYDGHRLVVGDSAPQIGIGDLQAIANNYSAHLQGYQVWRGHWNGTTTDWEATPRPNPNAPNPDCSADRPSPPPVTSRPTYAYQDDLTGITDTANVRYKVTAHGDGAAGAESNVATLLPYPLANSPWPKFRGNMQNTGQSQYVGAQTNTVKWTFQTGSSIDLASPSIGTDGTVYIGSDNGYFYALNPADGSMKWRAQTGGGASSGAVGADGTVYVGGYDGYIDALNPLDGTVKWRRKLTTTLVYSSPAIGGDGTIYIGCNASFTSTETFFALNPGDGSAKWKRPLGGGVGSSAAIGADGTIYVGGGDANLYALKPEDGSTKWSRATGGGVQNAPAVGTDGTVYCTSIDNNIYALNPDGSAKWTHPTSGYGTSSPGIGADGTLYVGSWDSNVRALSQSDGSVLWTFPTASLAEGSSAIGADGTVYICAWDTYAIAQDGTEKWHMSGIGDAVSSPAIGADGTVYFGCSSYVYAISP